MTPSESKFQISSLTLIMASELAFEPGDQDGRF
jgi:hypothetical protein